MNEEEIEHELQTSTLYSNLDFDINKFLLFESDEYGNENGNGNENGSRIVYDEKNDYEEKNNEEIKEFYTNNENKISCRNDAVGEKSMFPDEKGKKVELEVELEKYKKQNEKSNDNVAVSGLELELMHENEGTIETVNQMKKKKTNEIVAYLDSDKKCNSDISTTAELSRAETISVDGVILTIHNIICSANLGTQIDLRLVAISIRNAEYNPKKANTLIVRLNKPCSTALIFQTGRIMLTGAQTINDAIYGCRKVGKIIKKVTKKPVILKNFKIENMIAKADCNMPVRLESLAHDHKEYCNYEPELFAGLIFRHNPTGQQKSVILIFVSGKMVISGCKSVQKLNTVFQDVYNILKAYSI